MDSPGSARRDVGIAPYRVRADSPQTVRNQVRSARAAEGVGPYDENQPRRVCPTGQINSNPFFRRHVRRKNSLRRSVTRALAPTNRRAMEREYQNERPPGGGLSF